MASQNKWGRFGDVSAGHPEDAQTAQDLCMNASDAAAGGFATMGHTSVQHSPLPTPQGSHREGQHQFYCDMDSLDKKQEELINSQWKMLRAQIGSLKGAMTELKSEITQLKANVVTKEVELVLERMVEAHDGHENKHSGMLERIGYLETFIGEAADLNAAGLTEAKRVQDEQAMRTENGFRHLEGLIRDNSSRLGEQTVRLEGLIRDSSARQNEDTVRLEELIRDSSARQNEDTVRLEGLIRDSSARDLELEAACGSLAAIVEECARMEQHSNLEKRVEKLNEEFQQLVGESVAQQALQLEDHRRVYEEDKAATELRVADLDRTLQEHRAEVQKITTTLSATIATCAKFEHHAVLEQRVGYLQQSFDDTSGRHSRELADHRDIHAKLKASVQSQLEDMQSLHGTIANHAGAIEATTSRFGDITEALSLCSNLDSQKSLDQRVGNFERFLSESIAKQTKVVEELRGECYAKLESCMENIRDVFGKSIDRNTNDIVAARTDLDSFGLTLKGFVTSEEQRGGLRCLEQRVDSIAKTLGDSVDQHQKQLDVHSNCHAEHKTSMDTMDARLNQVHAALMDSRRSNDTVETKASLKALQLMLGETKQIHDEHFDATETRLQKVEHMVSVQHALQISNAQSKLVHLENDNINMDKRVSFLEEKRKIDVADAKSCYEFHKESTERRLANADAKHDGLETAIQKICTMEVRMTDFESKQCQDLEYTKDQLKRAEDLHFAVEERLSCAEQNISDSTDNTCRKFSTLEAGHIKLKNMYEELNCALNGQTSVRNDRYEDVEKRLAHLQVKMDAWLCSNSNDLEVAQAKLRDAHITIEQHRALQETHRTSVEQRCAFLESKLLEGGGSELMKEMEQRISYMQEDQKRQRDMMESSVFEKLREEHATIVLQASQIKEQWEREMKSRQAYMDTYKQLLSQERSARETSEAALSRRLEAFESQIHVGPGATAKFPAPDRELTSRSSLPDRELTSRTSLPDRELTSRTPSAPGYTAKSNHVQSTPKASTPNYAKMQPIAAPNTMRPVKRMTSPGASNRARAGSNSPSPPAPSGIFPPGFNGVPPAINSPSAVGRHSLA